MIDQFTTEQLNNELKRRQAEEYAKRVKAEQEREFLARQQAEIGKQDALIRVEQIRKELDVLIHEMDVLARKHHLQVYWDVADGGVSFGRFGYSGEGWDSSNC